MLESASAMSTGTAFSASVGDVTVTATANGLSGTINLTRKDLLTATPETTLKG
jgi:hypothetical protein